MTAAATPVRRGRRTLAILVVIAACALAASVRLRLAEGPLERDEGEYAYAAQLILDGIPPYAQAYNMKFPGVYYAYALVLGVFGESAWAIRVGLLLLNVATTFVVYALGRRLIGSDLGAAAAAAVFAIHSLDRGVMGTFAHATNFVLLPALGGLLLLLGARRPRTTAAAGLLFGIAILMKQQAAVFALLGIALLLRESRGAKSRAPGTPARAVGFFLGGLAIPFAIVVAVLAAQGVLDRFWFWTFQYARAYVAQIPLADAPAVLASAWGMMTVTSLPIWILSGAGLVALWLVRHARDTRWVITALAITSFVAMCPGFYFRPHYFVLLLPAAALLAGIALQSAATIARQVLPGTAADSAAVVLGAAVLALYVGADRGYLFSSTPAHVHRALNPGSPFMVAPHVAAYLRAHTSPADRIAVLGSEPEIYFYADRKAATGHIYMYGLMEPQPYAGRMQDELMAEVEAAHPAYIVEVRAQVSWLTRPASDPRVLAWMRRYLDACYTAVGVAETNAEGTSTVRWDRDAEGWQPQSDARVYTYRRTSDAPCRASDRR